ncbi:Protein NRT1/ PTR FAMILY 2.6 [Raphanus sativus]|nr:Protein NRT1/ PTR FAMILY 2.6 [Raphanus sativus]
MDVSVSGDGEAPMSADSTTKRQNGGWITFPFMIATLLFLSLAVLGWLFNLIVFLIEKFNMKSIAAAQVTNIVSGCTFMFPVVGAIAADSFFGTIPVISFSAFISLMAQTMRDSVKPMRFPSKIQLSVLYSAITLACVGAGGSRFTLATAGANQFKKIKDQSSFFNWFFFTWYFAAAISTTAIVYAEENISWTFGFGLCLAANLFGFFVFLSGKDSTNMTTPWEVHSQVYYASFSAVHKRKAEISIGNKDYHSESKAVPTKSFSVQQVEDFKVVIRIIPLALATLFLSTPIATQLSLTVLQGLVMDRSLGPKFKIPAGSLQVVTLLSTCSFIIVNDRLLYPFYQKLTGEFPTPLQRVGIGHVLNILSMALTAIVEAKRLKIVENGHFLESSSVADMSALWLFPSLVIVGIGEAFHFLGNVALCYQEFPASMKNTATSITSVVIGICFYTSTALINLIQRTTDWLPDDINHGRVDNVYWVLVIGGVLNLGYFLMCSWIYKYRNLEDDDHEKDSVISPP